MNTKAILCMVATATMLVCISATHVTFTPPIISDDFSAQISVTEFPGPETDSIFMWSDSHSNKFLSLTNETVGDSNFTVPVFDLHIYQTSENYVYSSVLSQCQVNTEVNGSFPSLFKWLSMATFEGQTMVYDQLVDVWVLNLNGGDMVLSLYAVGSIPVRLSQFVAGGGMGDNLTLIMDFNEFNPTAPNSAVFNIPAYCSATDQLTHAFGVTADGARTPLQHRVRSALMGQAFIHWECDICKAAAETIISLGCGAGSAVCGPFAEVCEAMCEGGCTAAGCSDWACKKFHFC